MMSLTDMVRVLFTPVPKPVVIPPNVQRIERIPYALLPDMSPARDALICLAWRVPFVDVDTDLNGEWRIWIEPGDPAQQDAHYSIEQWKAVCDRELARLLPPGTWQ